MKKNAKRVVVSVLNYNSWKNTLACLDSLLSQTYGNYKILLIDNGSVDDSASKITDYLRSKNVNYEMLYTKNGKITPTAEKCGDADVFFVISEENLGFAAGHNMGADFAVNELGADYVFILNNDAILEEKTIETLVHYAEKLNAAVIQPKVVELKDVQNKRRRAFMKITNFLRALRGNCNERRHNDVLEKRCKNGAAIMVRSDVIKKDGLFDERFFMYREDTDFFMRIHKKYGDCYVVLLTKVFHKGSQSSGGPRSPIAMYYMSRNGVYLIRKHYRGLQSTIKIIIDIFLIEQLKRLVQFTLIHPDLEMIKYYYMGIRDAARRKYGKREDLHVEYLRKVQKTRKQ